jgi:hypothetical protein
LPIVKPIIGKQNRTTELRFPGLMTILGMPESLAPVNIIEFSQYEFIWLNKMYHIYCLEYHSAVKKDDIFSFITLWIKLCIIMLSEISQAQKEKYYRSYSYVESKVLISKKLEVEWWFLEVEVYFPHKQGAGVEGIEWGKSGQWILNYS